MCWQKRKCPSSFSTASRSCLLLERSRAFPGSSSNTGSWSCMGKWLPTRADLCWNGRRWQFLECASCSIISVFLRSQEPQSIQSIGKWLPRKQEQNMVVTNSNEDPSMPSTLLKGSERIPLEMHQETQISSARLLPGVPGSAMKPEGTFSEDQCTSP